MHDPHPGLHLLIGGAAPSDQHHVEAREADDGDEEEAGHTHDGHAGPLRPTAEGEDAAAACGQTAQALPATHSGKATHSPGASGLRPSPPGLDFPVRCVPSPHRLCGQAKDT